MATRKTATAAKAPVKTDPELTEVVFRGETFTFPTDKQLWPTRALQRFRHRENVDAIEILLGPEQWYRLNQVAPLLGELGEFFERFREAVGWPADD